VPATDAIGTSTTTAAAIVALFMAQRQVGTARFNLAEIRSSALRDFCRSQRRCPLETPDLRRARFGQVRHIAQIDAGAFRPAETSGSSGSYLV
jgi:hypothetical protein